MRLYYLRKVAAIGSFGFAMGVSQLACGSRLGPVRASQDAGGIDRPNLPDITVEKAKWCMAEYGSQLEPGRHAFNSTVKVNEDGDKLDVSIDDIPETAPDFAACMRNVLRDMPIAEEPFRQGVETLKYRREQASTAQRSLVSSPVVIVVAGVAIVVSELVLEAGAYTVLFAVTVKVVEKAAEDVAEEGWRAVCAAHYAACMMSSVSKKKGNHWRQTRCGICERRCSTHKVWPDQVGSWEDDGSCKYWQSGWGH